MTKVFASLLRCTPQCIAVLSALAVFSVGGPAAAQYSEYGIGNTYNDETRAIGSMSQVLWTDGSEVVTDAYYSESAHEVQCLAAGDGSFIKNFADTHFDSPNGLAVDGRAITGNGSYIWASTATRGRVGRWSRTSGQQAGFLSVPPDLTEYVGGLAVRGNRLYVSVPANNVVLSYDISDSGSAGNYVGQFAVNGADSLATDSAGNIWVAQNIAGAPQVVLYDPNGNSLLTVPLPANSVIGQISSFSADGDAALVVADRGPDLNVKIFYYLAGSPGAGVITRTQVGTTGGVFASNTIAGQIDNSHFTDVRGVSADANGNIYVLCQNFGYDIGPVSNVPTNAGGATIRRFTKSGHTTWNFAWSDVGLHFEGIGDVDPLTAGGSSEDIYTGGERYSFNPSNGTSNYFSTLINPFKYPNDPRVTGSSDFAFIRRVNGERILFTTSYGPGRDYNGGEINVYTFNNVTDGETAIPVTLPYRLSAYTGFSIAPNCDIYGVDGNTIYYRPFVGTASSPAWGDEQAFAVGDTSLVMKRCVFDGTKLFVTAFADGYPPGPQGDGGIGGRLLLRFSFDGTNWNEEARAPVTFSDVDPLNLNVPQTLAQAGNYVFIGYYTVGSPDAGSTQAFPKQFGSSTDLLAPAQNFSTLNRAAFYPGNDTDSYYGTSASFNPNNGNYTVLKDDYNDYKIAAYVWHP